MAAPGKPELRALELKDRLQARAQSDLAGLSAEERLRRVREAVETGPFADAVKRWRKAKERCADELQRGVAA